MQATPLYDAHRATPRAATTGATGGLPASAAVPPITRPGTLPRLLLAAAATLMLSACQPEQNPPTNQRPQQASLAAADNGNPKPDAIELRLTGGDDPVSFTGTCVVHDAEGNRHEHDVAGRTPAEHRFHGQRIACRITLTDGDGRLTVELASPGNVARSSTRGAGSTVNVRMR